MVELKRMARFEVDKGIISQFQLDSDRFKRRIKTIISKDERELKYQYTDLTDTDQTDGGSIGSPLHI